MVYSLFSICGVQMANAVSVPSHNLHVTDKSCRSLSISWNRGDGTLCLVTCRVSKNAATEPANNIGYSANKQFGFGADLGNENYCIYSGNDSVVTVFGLNENTEYVFQVYEFDYDPYVYLTENPPMASGITHTLSANASCEKLDSCQNRNRIKFSANATATFPVSGYIWSFSDTSIENQIHVKKLEFAGKNTVKMTVLPEMGCLEDMKFLEINITPGIEKGEILTDSFLCTNKTIIISSELKLGSVQGTSFTRLWTLDSVENYNASRIQKSYHSPGKHHVRLIVYTFSKLVFTGCSDTIYSEFIVKQGPYFEWIRDTCFPKGDLLNLQSPIIANSYYWNGIKGKRNYFVLDTGFVYLTVVGQNGCNYTDSVEVVYCKTSGLFSSHNGKSFKVTADAGKLHLMNELTNPCQFNIHNNSGQFIRTGKLEPAAIMEIYLPPGIYLISVPGLGNFRSIIY